MKYTFPTSGYYIVTDWMKANNHHGNLFSLLSKLGIKSANPFQGISQTVTYRRVGDTIELVGTGMVQKVKV